MAGPSVFKMRLTIQKDIEDSRTWGSLAKTCYYYFKEAQKRATIAKTKYLRSTPYSKRKK